MERGLNVLLELSMLKGSNRHLLVDGRLMPVRRGTSITGSWWKPELSGRALVGQYRGKKYYPYGRRETINMKGSTILYYDELALMDILR